VAGFGDPRKIGDCDKISWARVLDTAARTSFEFTGNMKLETIVHNKFSGPSPHEAKAFERIYFTREYGITRWEQWLRADHPELQVQADGDGERAKKYYAAQLAPSPRGPATCSKPVVYPKGAGFIAENDMKVSPATSYTQRFKTDGGSWETFHLVDCEDMTGHIIKGDDIRTVYGGAVRPKWSLQDISRFLKAPSDGSDKLSVETQLESFFKGN
jgi:hypothetical protein